jgi:hypothetical protein
LLIECPWVHSRTDSPASQGADNHSGRWIAGRRTRDTAQERAYANSGDRSVRSIVGTARTGDTGRASHANQRRNRYDFEIHGSAS